MYKDLGIISIIIILFLMSCKNEKKQDLSKVFYVEYETKDDSLKNQLNAVTNNKVTYYDEIAKVLRIIPKDYLTNSNRDIHWLFAFNELKESFKENTQKYKINYIRTRKI